MTKTKVRPFDVAEHLDSPETIAAYLNEASETGDMAFMLSAIRDVASARGLTAVAKETGFAREALYRALNRDGNPEFATLMGVIAASAFASTCTLTTGTARNGLGHTNVGHHRTGVISGEQTVASRQGGRGARPECRDTVDHEEACDHRRLMSVSCVPRCKPRTAWSRRRNSCSAC